MASLKAAARDAEACAAAAAGRALVDVHSLDDIPSLREAADVLRRTWSTTADQAPMGPEVLRALTHAGNYVAGAFRSGQHMVGVSVGFLGEHGGAIHLHSHITGVVPGTDGQGAGFALKQHQRSWALDRGLDTITWTFDPLIRRNAYFNLAKLGARVIEYHPRFYGAMDDTFNAGDETDRAVAQWLLVDERAVSAAGGDARRVDIESLEAAGVPVILRADEGGSPLVAKVDGASRALAWIPEDIVEIRHRDPELARRWRHALRDAIAPVIGDGFAAVEMSRSGWYVLQDRERA
jgi:predicted GNAT superfamily acetyltransferase